LIPADVLANFIDYAGLFPPADLGLREAVLNYVQYRQSEHRGILGRLIIPLHQLENLARLQADRLSFPLDDSPWPISCTFPPDAAESWDAFRSAVNAVKRHNDVAIHASSSDISSRARTRVDSIEFAPSDPGILHSLCREIPNEWSGFVEFPFDRVETYVGAIRQTARLYGKLRMGGTSAEKFPGVPQVIEGLNALCEAGVRFKCTAGLHHPLRGRHPLTYASDAPQGTMHGFINVLLAVVALRRGNGKSQATTILEDGESHHFRASPDGLHWKEALFPWSELVAARNEAFVGFGSCSFTEPLDDLAQLGWHS
jgi:hypothetical protein